MRFPRVTFGKILAGTAVVLLATSGTAYAVATITSADIVDETIKSVDVKNGSLTTNDILNGTIRSGDIADGTITGDDVADASIGGIDITDGSVGGNDVTDESITAADLGVDSVQATEVADNSIDAGEIVDFGLTNEDIGVLEAEVNADGTLASGDHAGTVSSLIGTGVYEVDFALNVASCTPVVSQGEAGVGGAAGAIMGVTDRSGNANAFFVTARDAAGALINTAWHIVVVC